VTHITFERDADQYVSAHPATLWLTLLFAAGSVVDCIIAELTVQPVDIRLLGELEAAWPASYRFTPCCAFHQRHFLCLDVFLIARETRRTLSN
jgi:hypothetical protein